MKEIQQDAFIGFEESFRLVQISYATKIEQLPTGFFLNFITTEQLTVTYTSILTVDFLIGKEQWSLVKRVKNTQYSQHFQSNFKLAL